MSWKLAEWRWREQAPLRARSLWKVWDVEDAVRSGDLVEETVRFAYHFSEQVDGCWQSRVETTYGKGLGSIRSGQNPHPPPLSQLPELPPHNHTSYHPSHSSSAPLLGTTEKTSVALGGSHSTSSSISVLLSKSASSTPTVCATPRTPQLATDFLDSRDWNHLAIDQKLNSEATAEQLRSSFGLFNKTINRPHSKQYPQLAPQVQSLGRRNTTTKPLLRRSLSSNFALQGQYQATQEPDTSLEFLHNRVVPWSNLDTVFEDQKPIVNHYLQHEGFAFDIFDSHDLPSELFSEGRSYFYNHSSNSTALLLPDEDMAPLRIGKSKESELTKAKPKRADTPPARVFEDLPSAYTGIVRQSIAPVQVMKNMTGTLANLPPLIDLPRTPPRPGPASPALQQKLAEAKDSRERQKLSSMPGRPVPVRPLSPLLPDSPCPQVLGARQGRLDNDIVPASDFISRGDQSRELRRATSHESLPKERALVRNSRSFFDSDRDSGLHEVRNTQHPDSRAAGVSAAPSTVDRVVEMYSSAGSLRTSNSVVPRSQNIPDVAISGLGNPTLMSEGRDEFPMPAPLRINRRQVSAGRAPAEGLPRVPSGIPRYQHQQIEFPSSEVAEYDNTQSVLNVPHFARRPAIGEGCKMQNVRTRRESDNDVVQDVDKDRCGTAADDFGHELSRCGPRQPQGVSSGLSQLSGISDDIDMSATAPYHTALKAMYDKINPDETGLRCRERTIPGSGQPVDREWTSSRLSEDESLAQLAIGEQDTKLDQDCEAIGKPSDRRDVFKCYGGSSEWFACAAKKETRKKPAESADDCDWETVQESAVNSEQLSQAALQPLQPPFEPLLPTPSSKTEPQSDASLADFACSGFGSIPASQADPASPWDPIQKGATRVRPAHPGTPHKYRLRKDTVTGERIYVPEDSLPGFDELTSSSNAESAQAAPDLPTEYLIPISKFSASTPRQQALAEDTSSDKEHPSSPSIITQRRHKTRMATFNEEQDRAQGRLVNEPEGDHSHGIGIAISTNEVPDDQKSFPRAESTYSLASEDIVQDEPMHMGATVERRPANIPGTRSVVNYASSDEISIRDGLRYGEEGGGIEMERMGTDRTFSIGTLGTVSSRGEILQNTSSQVSLPYQSRLMSQARHESDDDLLKRLSTIDDDGSYEGEAEMASASSYLRENNPFTPRSANSNKRTYSRASGTLGRTGIRGTGSSPAYESSNIYDPAMQRKHRYSELSSDPAKLTGYGDYIDDIIEPSSLTHEQVQRNMQLKGIDTNKITFGNVQKDVTGIVFPMGQAISAPKPVVLPRTVPAINSFVLTKEQPLRIGTSTHKMALDRIKMAQDDWFRLNQPCPVFPLRDEHLAMTFVEGDLRRVGDTIYNRGDASRSNGLVEEDGFCFEHGRREFSTAPTLHKTPLSAELERIRKKAGREVVWTCMCIPIPGWVMLYYLWKNEDGMRVDGEVMRWRTGGVVGEMGAEEKVLAGAVLAWSALGLCGAAFACVALLILALLSDL